MAATDTPAPEALAPLDLPDGLQLREPTGAVTFPFILCEGEEKAGKTYAACAFAASPLVGHVFAIDLGEGTLDEYASLGPYQIVVHNGTYMDIVGQLELVLSIPSDPARPNVIVIDSMTNLWKLIVRWLDGRARKSRANRAKLEKDPDAEIVITQNLWNDGKARWRRIVDQLMTYPGIVVVTARGKEVTEVDGDGNPTGVKVWAVEAEKTLTWDVTAWVRFVRGADPKLIAVRSLLVDVPAAGIDLPRKGTLEHLAFTVLGAGTAFSQRDAAIPVVGVHPTEAKTRVLAFLEHQGVKHDLAVQQASTAWKACGLEQKPEVTEGEIMAVVAWLRQANVGDWNTDADTAPTDEEVVDTALPGAKPDDVDAVLGADLPEPAAGAEEASGGAPDAPAVEPGEHLIAVVPDVELTDDELYAAVVAAQGEADLLAPLIDVALDRGLDVSPPAVEAWKAEVDAEANLVEELGDDEDGGDPLDFGGDYT